MNDYSSNLLCDPKELAGLDPAKTAHICIDVQDYYFHPEKSEFFDENMKESADNVAKRIAHIAPLFNQAGLSKTIWVYHMCAGKEWYVVKPDEAQGDEVFGKMGYSAFEGKKLKKRIEELGIENLILTGGYTSCCVQETAADALKDDYKVVVLTDCIQNCEEPLFDSELVDMFSVKSRWSGKKKQALFTNSDTLLNHMSVVQPVKSAPSNKDSIWRLFPGFA